MSAPELWLVSAGEYADKRPLAVFDDGDLAQAWADRWTLAHLDEVRGVDGRAHVDQRLPYNPTEVNR